MTLTALDYVVAGIYLLGIAVLGSLCSRREKSTGDFFLAGQRIPWWAAGLSIVGTQISAIMFMAIPAQIFARDWTYFIGTAAVMLVTPVAGFLFLPFFRRQRIVSAYEYLGQRFGPTCHTLGSILFFLMQLGRIAVVQYLPALALHQVTGLSVVTMVILVGVLTLVYTVLGGIEAVIWTDVVQVVIFSLAATLMLGKIITGVPGGVPEILAMGAAQEKFRLFAPGLALNQENTFVIFVGGWFLGLVPYCADQAVVQRYLTTPTEAAARRSLWLLAAAVIPINFLFFSIGSALWAYYQAHPGQIEGLAHRDSVVPFFLVQHMSGGLAGLVLAAIFAATMSTLDSSLNSMATISVQDFYRRRHPDRDEREYLRVARWMTVFWGLMAIGGALVLDRLNDRSLWEQAIQLLGLFGGSLVGLFLAGLLSRRINSAGVLAGVAASVVVMAAVFFAQPRPVSFFLFSGVGMAVVLLVAWPVSLLFPPPPAESLRGLTVWTLKDRSEVPAEG